MDEKKLTDKKLQETLNKICNARKNQYANMKLGHLELISIEEHKKQLVETRKDTAKEIYSEIGDDDILVISTQEYGKIEVVTLERLQEIVKGKGVEVK